MYLYLLYGIESVAWQAFWSPDSGSLYSPLSSGS